MALAVVEAIGVGLLLEVSFIIGFFIFREPARKTNDDDEVIIQRFKSVGAVCVLAPLLVFAWLSHRGALAASGMTFLELLGLRLDGLLPSLVLPLLLVALLFLGPLVLSFMDEDLPLQANFDLQRDVVGAVRSLMGLRNIVVAPFAEEFIFRSCIVPGLFLAGLSPTAIILGCPLYFGTAHLHHVRDLYKRAQLQGKRDAPLQRALLQAGFQFVYTTLFGMFSTFLFLRTGHLAAAFVCHSFCNVMGFPAFERISHHASYKLAIWSAFVAGLVLFGVLLFPLTEPSLSHSAYWRPAVAS